MKSLKTWIQQLDEASAEDTTFFHEVICAIACSDESATTGAGSIEKGADINAGEDNAGWTPLHVAAYSGYKAAVELLAAKGADVNAKDEDGKTSLDWATHPDNPNASAEIADLLRQHGGKTGEELKAEGK